MGRKRGVLAVLALLVLAFAWQGARPLWEPDEGRYSAVAMEMLRLGDWLQPHLHRDHLHWTKPPLTYWAIAASVGALGRHEFAVRLPSILAFVGCTLLVLRMGRVLLGDRAWIAPLVYASLFMPASVSNVITTDGLLTLWETAAVCAYVISVWDDRVRGDRTILLMWAAFGLAFLTKGPPGLLPLLPIVLFQRFGLPRARRRPLRWAAGLAVLVAINAPWYGAVVALHPELVRYYLVEEIVERNVSDSFGRNPEWYGAFTTYLPVLLVGSLPWTWVLVRAAGRGVRRWFGTRTGGEASGGRLAGFRAATADARGSQGLFLALWIVAPLVVFFVARSRLELYLLPLFAPMALVVARSLHACGLRWTRARVALLAVWLAALLGVRFFAATISDNRDSRAMAAAVRDAVGGPIDEVAFYDTRALWGFNFYLDAEVEEVPGGGLPDELTEVPGRTWIMRPDDRPAFQGEAERQGVPHALVGRIEDWYDILQPAPTGAGTGPGSR